MSHSAEGCGAPDTILALYPIERDEFQSRERFARPREEFSGRLGAGFYRFSTQRSSVHPDLWDQDRTLAKGRGAIAYAGGTYVSRRRGREAEGGGLLNRYRVSSPIEGSNPSVSANSQTSLQIRSDTIALLILRL